MSAILIAIVGIAERLLVWPRERAGAKELHTGEVADVITDLLGRGTIMLRSRCNVARRHFTAVLRVVLRTLSASTWAK